MQKFNEKQIEAIELLARAEYDGITQQQIADIVGVDARTIRRWNKDKRFKDAVGRKSMELIAGLSPVIFKTTAEFLQSKDQRIQAKGVDVFLKASATIEAKEQEEAEKNKDIDIDNWILEHCPTFESVKNKEEFLRNDIFKTKENIKLNVTSALLQQYRLKLLLEGHCIEDIIYLSNKYETSPQDVYGLLNSLYNFQGNKDNNVKDIEKHKE